MPMNLLSSVLPILGVDSRSQPSAVGTGFLIQVLDKCLLVTAAHVADEMQNSPLYIPSTPGESLIELPQTAICTKAPPAGRDEDKIDLAFWDLPAAIIEQIENAFWIVPSLFLLPAVEGLPPQQLSFVGFPHKATRIKYGTRKLTSGPEQFTGVCVEEALYQQVNAGLSTHLAIEFDHKRAMSAGQIVTPKDRHGMSGGPVYALTDGGSLEGLPKIRIVGVAIEHHRSEGLLLATKTELLLQMISKHFQLAQIAVSNARLV